MKTPAKIGATHAKIVTVGHLRGTTWVEFTLALCTDGRVVHDTQTLGTVGVADPTARRWFAESLSGGRTTHATRKSALRALLERARL